MIDPWRSPDLVERLEERAAYYENSADANHDTAALLREAKLEIEALRNVTAWRLGPQQS
jgi:hypothetical protein